MRDAMDLSRNDAERRRGRAEAIEDFLGRHAPSDDSDLLSQMMVTMCRLTADGAERGDLKILNSALRELRYAFKVFAPYHETPKVSIFGSSRTPEDHPQYQEAMKFAGLMQKVGWMVITGAGDGIMRAGHHGATPGSSFGVAISLPFEQATNTIIANDAKLVNFKYFFTRKLVFVKESVAIALFPGGFGTQDEGFESLTLVQTLKTTPKPIVLCDEPGGTYWLRWQEFVKEELLRQKMIDATDMDLYTICDTAEEAVDEILRFYRCYHSSRYVDERLVFRLNSPLSADLLADINANYTDILNGGGFEQRSEPLPEENGEFPDKTRLVFAFDRRNAGRLRGLINRINAES